MQESVGRRSRLFFGVVVLVLLTACGEDAAPAGITDVLETSEIIDVVKDTPGPDLGPPPPPKTDFGTVCTDNSDCEDLLCFMDQGEDVCSQLCVTDCPHGWSCGEVANPQNDVLFACVSDYPTLCLPCKNDDDCQGPSGAKSACIQYGPQGNFCGGACIEGECPEGMACKSVETIDGAQVSQCVAEAGVCSCSSKAIASGLTTSCYNENETGRCDGNRSCSSDGLSDCNAAEPIPEICNGLDDDCNDAVDDMTCDDEDSCTEDTCQGEAGCDFVAVSGLSCDDSDPCTENDVCDTGQCVGGSPKDCSDQNPCTVDLCDASGKCDYQNNTDACDDTIECTVTDLCVDGVCTSGSIDADHCLIDGVCIAAGTLHENGCLGCIPTTSQDVWSPIATENDCTPCEGGHCTAAGECAAEVFCDDNVECTQLTQCTQGACVGFVMAGQCFIDGSCHKKGSPSPNGCAGCIPADSQDSWTPSSDNDSCTACDGGFCTNFGSCEAAVSCDDNIPCSLDTTCQGDSDCGGGSIEGTSCLIDATCITTGAISPTTCSRCEPSTSQIGWTPFTTADSCTSCLGIGHCTDQGDCSQAPVACTGQTACTDNVCSGGTCVVLDIQSGFCLIDGAC